MNHIDDLCISLQPPGILLVKVEWGNLCCVVLRVLDMSLFTLGVNSSGDKNSF